MTVDRRGRHLVPASVGAPNLTQQGVGVNEAPAASPTAWQLTAMTIVVCTGFSSQMVVPIWIGQVIDHFRVSAAVAGSIASLEFAAVAITSVITATLVGRAPGRLLCVVGTVLLMAGNLACTFAPTLALLGAARLVCGVGKGLVIAIIFGLAGQSGNPTRSFAVLNAAYAAFSAAVFLVVPRVVIHFGMAGAFGSMVALSLLGLVFLPGVPEPRRTAHGESWIRSLPLDVSGMLAIAGLTLMWTAQGSIWAFSERIGVRDGLSLQSIGWVLSAGSILAIAGPLASRVLEIRRGALLPIFGGLAVLAAVVIWVCVSRSTLTYALAVPIISIAALFLMPYVQGVLSFVDPSGKLNAGSSAFMTLGGALGPLLGGMLIARGGFATLGACAAVLLIIVFGLFRPAARAHDAAARAS